jgi:hypothetical protein
MRKPAGAVDRFEGLARSAVGLRSANEAAMVFVDYASASKVDAVAAGAYCDAGSAAVHDEQFSAQLVRQNHGCGATGLVLWHALAGLELAGAYVTSRLVDPGPDLDWFVRWWPRQRLDVSGPGNLPVVSAGGGRPGCLGVQPLDALFAWPEPDPSGGHVDPAGRHAQHPEGGCGAEYRVTGERSFALVVMDPDGLHVGRHECGNGLWRRRRDGLPVLRAAFPLVRATYKSGRMLSCISARFP